MVKDPFVTICPGDGVRRMAVGGASIGVTLTVALLLAEFGSPGLEEARAAVEL